MQMNKIRNEQEVITTDLMDIKKTIKWYYKQHYDHQFDVLHAINSLEDIN